MSDVQANPRAVIRPIPNLVGYHVGDDGSIWTSRCKARGRGAKGKVISDGPMKPLATRPQRYGYPLVNLYDGKKKITRTIHSLVMETFVGPRPDRFVVCHNNGNPKDNRLANLRYDTDKANKGDMREHGTLLQGDTHPRALVTTDQVGEIRRLCGEGVKHHVVAARFGISRTQVCAIANGKAWRNLPSS